LSALREFALDDVQNWALFGVIYGRSCWHRAGSDEQDLLTLSTSSPKHRIQGVRGPLSKLRSKVGSFHYMAETAAWLREGSAGEALDGARPWARPALDRYETSASGQVAAFLGVRRAIYETLDPAVARTCMRTPWIGKHRGQLSLFQLIPKAGQLPVQNTHHRVQEESLTLFGTVAVTLALATALAQSLLQREFREAGPWPLPATGCGKPAQGGTSADTPERRCDRSPVRRGSS
jgi:hypothetical protein